jgi:hypothetical protein
MNKICTSLEQSKKLIELGISFNTADMGWNVFVDNTIRLLPIDDWDLVKDGSGNVKFYPAWSFTALFKMLPYSARIEKGSSSELYCVTLPNELRSYDWYVEPIDAVFEMVYWLLTK